MKKSKYVDWLIRMLGYALVLIAVSIVFKNTIYIDNSYYGLYALFAAVIIYILNQTTYQRGRIFLAVTGHQFAQCANSKETYHSYALLIPSLGFRL